MGKPVAKQVKQDVRARVYEPHETRAEGDALVETRRVAFFGSALAGIDSSVIEVRFADADTLQQARAKIVTAAVAEGLAIGYEVARGRVVYPELSRGS